MATTTHTESISDSVTLWACAINASDLKWKLVVDGEARFGETIPADDDQDDWDCAFRCAAKCGVSEAAMDDALNNALNALGI